MGGLHASLPRIKKKRPGEKLQPTIEDPQGESFSQICQFLTDSYSEKRPKTEPFDPTDVFTESESESEDGSDDEEQIQSPQSDQNQPATKSEDLSDAVDALLAFKSLKPDIPEVKPVRKNFIFIILTFVFRRFKKQSPFYQLSHQRSFLSLKC